jgi:hypothetical protein
MNATASPSLVFIDPSAEEDPKIATTENNNIIKTASL